jgi:hypothetical protein
VGGAGQLWTNIFVNKSSLNSSSFPAYQISSFNSAVVTIFLLLFLSCLSPAQMPLLAT